MRAFRNAYFSEHKDTRLRVLDVGSGCSRGSLSCRELFPPPVFEYVGLDITDGHNVDVVPDDPYRWTNLETESFDVVVSNQVFEHIPFFWITAAEIARVLTQEGLLAVVSPSSGYPHRYPVDCWRFYPDSWTATCHYVGLDLIESYREPLSWRKVIPGIYWRDAMMVARKPRLTGEGDRARFYDRIEAIVATRTDSAAVPLKGILWGAATRTYEATHTMPIGKMAAHPFFVRKLIQPRLRRAWARSWGGALLRRIRSRQGRQALEHGSRVLPWP